MVYPLNDTRRDDFYAFSSANVLKADNIRLQYIRVSYNLNRSLLRKIDVRDLQFYANFENLGLLWRANDEGLDPEFDAGNSAYLPPKRIALGLKLDF